MRLMWIEIIYLVCYNVVNEFCSGGVIMKKILSLVLLLSCILTFSYAEAAATLEIQDPLSFFGEDLIRSTQQQSRDDHTMLNIYALSKSGASALTGCYTEYLNQLDSVVLVDVAESRADGSIYYCYAPAEGYDLQTFDFSFTDTEGQLRSPAVCIQIMYYKNSVRFYYGHSMRLVDHGVRVDDELATYLQEIAWDEEQERIKALLKAWGKTTTPAAGGGCDECNGTGKCQECGGDMWVTEWEWVYVNGSPVSQLVTKLCDGIYCYGGSCLKCR